MRGFVSIETFILFLILLTLVVGFLPGLIAVNNAALSGVDPQNPAFIALAIVPLVWFFGPFRRLFNSGDE